MPWSEEFACVAMLKACARNKDIYRGIRIHADLSKTGLLQKKKSPYLVSALISMYARCGELAKAHGVLQQQDLRCLVSWNALISGYAAQQGHPALPCFERMHTEGISPDAVTLMCTLKACGKIGAIHKGKQIHSRIVGTSLLRDDIVLGTALVSFYSKCGVLLEAQQVLEELHTRDTVSWSTLIAGYAQQGQGHAALGCFEQMRSEGHSPDVVTFISILQACGSTRSIKYGRQIHDEIVSQGMLEKDPVLGNALLDMYAKCGVLAKAQQVLQKIPVRDIISWNAMMSGYVQQERCQEALTCFECMQCEGVSPDAVTFICMLKACGSIGALGMGKKIHEKVIQNGLLDKDIIVGNALVDMYAKCGVLSKAHQVLEELPIRDIVSWNALITGYAQLGQCREALDCLDWMQMEGLKPNSVTFVSIIKACGSNGAIDKGMEVHDEIISRGLLAMDIVFGNALVDMYAKCGVLSKALQVLDEIPMRDTVSWSALIAGYAQQGRGLEALCCFQRMESEGFSPDKITFLCVLNACNHSGLLDQAQMLFWNMSKEYGISPTIEHCTCMVAVFGNSGHWDKAKFVIKSMPYSDSPAVWLALLDACKKWGNVKLGKLAFYHLVKLDHSCPTAYVLMINIFAAAGMQEDVEKIRAMRLKFSDKLAGRNKEMVWS